jgi:hypothetical protein
MQNPPILGIGSKTMQRILPFISLPLLCGAAFLILSHNSAFAASQAEQATQLLARSQVLDAKCKFLTNEEHDELSSLVAKAELALAHRTSIDITKQTLAAGRVQGQGATCNDSERADISNILSSARQAAAAAPKVEVVQSPLPKPKITLKAKRIKVALIAAVEAPKKPQVKMKSALLQYASITEKYYLARRCGSMSARQIQSLYSNVVDSHHAVLSDFGRNAVANVMQQSESKANELSCG